MTNISKRIGGVVLGLFGTGLFLLGLFLAMVVFIVQPSEWAFVVVLSLIFVTMGIVVVSRARRLYGGAPVKSPTTSTLMGIKNKADAWLARHNGLTTIIFLAVIITPIVWLIVYGERTPKDPQPSAVSACEAAKERFRACESQSGDRYVDCLANINAPPGCGETSLQHLSNKANAR